MQKAVLAAEVALVIVIFVLPAAGARQLFQLDAMELDAIGSVSGGEK